MEVLYKASISNSLCIVRLSEETSALEELPATKLMSREALQH